MIVQIPDWIINNLDFVGYFCIALGVWKFSKISSDGFFYAMIGSMILLAWGIAQHHWGTIIWNVLFSLLYYNAYKQNQKLLNLLK